MTSTLEVKRYGPGFLVTRKGTDIQQQSLSIWSPSSERLPLLNQDAFGATNAAFLNWRFREWMHGPQEDLHWTRLSHWIPRLILEHHFVRSKPAYFGSSLRFTTSMPLNETSTDAVQELPNHLSTALAPSTHKSYTRSPSTHHMFGFQAFTRPKEYLPQEHGKSLATATDPILADFSFTCSMTLHTLNVIAISSSFAAAESDTLFPSSMEFGSANCCVIDFLRLGKRCFSLSKVRPANTRTSLR